MQGEERELFSVPDADAIQWMTYKSKDFIELMTYYRCAMMQIETKFKVLNEHYSLEHHRNPIQTIKTRLKNPLSIQKKLERFGRQMRMEEIEGFLNDVAGVRIICSFVEDVYVLSEALLSQDDITLVAKKDYIKKPKANGYRSLHLIVSIPIFLSNEKRQMRVEIQLRTIAMDIWASLEHQLNYKKEESFSKALSKELFACAELASALDERMNCLYEQMSRQWEKQEK